MADCQCSDRHQVLCVIITQLHILPSAAAVTQCILLPWCHRLYEATLASDNPAVVSEVTPGSYHAARQASAISTRLASEVPSLLQGPWWWLCPLMAGALAQQAALTACMARHQAGRAGTTGQPMGSAMEPPAQVGLCGCLNVVMITSRKGVTPLHAAIPACSIALPSAEVQTLYPAVPLLAGKQHAP